MRINRPFGRLGLAALTGLAFGGWSGVAEATITIDLKAMEYTMTLPGGATVTMWGFARTNAAGTVILEGPSSPGPTIVVPANETQLVLRVRNGLPANADPFVQSAISVVAPGLKAVSSFSSQVPPRPVTFTDPSGRKRIRSLTQERLPGTATRAYNFVITNPGTYLYHSGTHPAVQVQMGLYGAIVKDFAAGQAYSGVAYESSAVVVLSEIDAQLHADVKSGNYVPFGNPDIQRTSTIAYTPVYYLVNGKPYDPNGAALPVPGAVKPFGDQGLDGGAKGGKHLVRVVNAGLKSRVPVINGGALSLIAEDGKPYPYPRRQTSAHIAAGQTLDLFLETPDYGVYTMFDRMLGLSNANGSAGGQYAKFVVHDAVQTTAATFTTAGRQLAVQGSSNSTLPSPATMTAWGTYNNGSPALSLGAVPFASANAGLSLYQATFTIPAATTRPDAVVLVSSLGGSQSRTVTVQ